MTKLGAYVGTTPAQLSAYESWLGRPLDNVLVSINQTGWDAFDGSINWDVNQWLPTGRSMIWSVPLTVTGTALEQTATGAFDAHYLKAAQALAQTGSGAAPIYVRVGWEFNIPGQPWAAQGHEQAFIQSYQNLVNTFRSVSDRFKFVWDANIGGAYNPAMAYPGDKYVDVIGADMYYNPQWDGSDSKAAFATKVTEQYGLQWQQDFAAAHNKPTAMSEWSVDTNGSAAYITAAQQWFASHNMLYANYWESNAAYSGELHNGENPAAGAAYRQAFGATATSAAVPAIPVAYGSADTSTLTGTGNVVVDLSGGFVSKAGITRLTLANALSVQLGADPSTVYGMRSGSDSVTGGSGSLSVYGQGANDTIRGGSGALTVMGGSGAEAVTSGGATVMYGGTGTNTLVGGAKATSQDTFYGKGGADSLTGQGGTVTLYGGGGTEKLQGGSGTNTLYGGSGTNILTGLMQPDSTGHAGTNILYGGTGSSAGVDIYYAGAGTNLLYEGSGTDYFASNAGTDTIYGGSGNSFVYGGTGTQTIFTGAGNQHVWAGGGTTLFFDTAANLKAGRYDQIDQFAGAHATDLYLPNAVLGATAFVSQNGGAAILTSVGSGIAEIFVSNASVASVQAHTHFAF